MRNPFQSPSQSSAALTTVLLLSILASACDSGGENATNQASDAADADLATEGESNGNTGTITVGDDTWTVVPETQCSVYSGDTVAIAGHAAEDAAIEIVLDHDPSLGLVQAYVKGPDDSPHWVAGKEDISFKIDGKSVTGSGNFSVGLGAPVEEGKPREARGTFEINC